MRVILFGATGMIGSGVLAECLADAGVRRVLAIGRTTTGIVHPKLEERLLPDLFTLADAGIDLAGFDAVFFCLGVSSVGMDEKSYRRITLDLTVVTAQVLGAVNPGIPFCYVSGEGADATESGRVMWARVKGQVENALVATPTIRAYNLRPGFVQPTGGTPSKTRLYRVTYRVLRPFYPLLQKLFPRHVITTREVGRAMIALARKGADERVFENPDIRALARDAEVA